MKRQTFDKPKRMNVLKMSIDEIDKSNRSSKKEMKQIILKKDQISSRNLSPNKPNDNKPLKTHITTLTSPLPTDTTNAFLIKSPTIITSQHNITNFTDCIINQLERNVSSDSIRKRDNSFDYKIIQKNKLLLPMNSINQVRNMRLCEKSLLPNEKNYFISEKNFKLIAETLSQKESDIENLQVLLDLARSDLKNSNNSLASNSNEIDKLTARIEQLHKENAKLNTNYNDIMFQFNKMMGIHSRMAALFLFIRDCIKSHSDITKEFTTKIDELELSGVVKLFTHQENLGRSSNEFDFLDKNEQLCREYKKKVADAQELLSEYEKIDQSKLDGLSEIAKDMLKTKQRIKELNELNDQIEKDNTYLRLSYQNIYCESEGKNRKSQNQIQSLNKKLDEQSRALSNMQNENNQLLSENKEARGSLMQQLQVQSVKDSKLAELENKLNLLSETIKDRENIIAELKTRITEYEAKKAITDSMIKTSAYQLNKKKKEDHIEEIYDDVFKNLNTDQIKDAEVNNRKDKANFKPKPQNSDKAKLEGKKDLEITMLKEKVASLEKEEKNLYFEGDNEDIGVNGVIYISDLFLHLYNQAKVIEHIIK